MLLATKSPGRRVELVSTVSLECENPVVVHGRVKCSTLMTPTYNEMMKIDVIRHGRFYQMISIGRHLMKNGN